MSSNELADVAVGTYQELGGPILRHTAVPTLLCLASIVFITSYVLPAFGVTSHPHDLTAQVGEAVVTMLIALFVAAPLFIIGISYSSAFITGLVSDHMIGAEPNAAESAQRALKLLPKLFVLALWETFTCLSGLLVATGLLMASALTGQNNPDTTGPAVASGLGILAMIVGFITLPVVASRHALAVPLAVVEGLSPRAAAKRSAYLLKGYLFQPSGYNSVTSIMALIFVLSLFLFGGIYLTLDTFGISGLLEGALAGSVFRDIVMQVLHYLPWFLTLWTVVPVWCTTSTILYYERRTRLEGFDIETLARDLSQHAKQNRFEL
jgi:hypothetical protein